MSEKLCALRKIGGGTLKETVLWTNEYPTSGQGSQVFTLNQSYEHFDFVRIKFKSYYTQAVNEKTIKSIYVTPIDLYNTFDQNGNPSAVITTGRRGEQLFEVGKYIYSGDYTKVGINSVNTNTGIILEISGIKL